MTDSAIRYVAAALPDDLDDAVDTRDDLRQLVAERRNAMIGRSLRYARDTAGMKQQDVADAMGVEQSRISQIEGAEGHSISLGVLARYATAVGCAVNIDLVNNKSLKLVTRVLVSPTTNEGLAPRSAPSPLVFEKASGTDLRVVWNSVAAKPRQSAQRTYDKVA